MMAAPDDPEWSLGDPLTTSTAGTRGLMEYLTPVAIARRADPGDDLISQLALAEIDGEKLTDEQLGFNGVMFFAAGHETTRAALSAGLRALIADPRQFDLLRGRRHDRALLQTASEEFVRWASPLTHVLRTATEDFDMNGTLIRAGQWVVPWLPAANRDPAAFARADEFDVTRAPNVHLAFAAGKYACLGAHLARLEIRVMLEFVLEFMADIKIAGPIEMAASNLFSGIKHMPIRFRRVAGRSKMADFIAGADGARLAAE